MTQEELNTAAAQEKQIARKDVQNTPFSIIENTENQKCMIAVGNAIIVDKEFENENEAAKYIKDKPWDLILNTCAMFTQYCIKQKSITKNTQNNA